MNAYLVDDEPLAVTRLRGLLEADGRIRIAGATSNPGTALTELRRSCPDVLFLDIEMPGMSGFELLEQLGSPQPLVVFTTAWDRYALEAFRKFLFSYLLKPIDTQKEPAAPLPNLSAS